MFCLLSSNIYSSLSFFIDPMIILRLVCVYIYTLTTYKFQTWTVVRHYFMWNQSHLSEQLADVVSELPPSAEGEMVIMTKSLPFMLEWDHCLQCPSQPQPQLLSNKIIKLCKVGKTPFWWHKQEHLFSIPSGKPNGLMLVLGWLYSEVHGGSEMVPLMTVSLYIGLLCMIF